MIQALLSWLLGGDASFEVDETLSLAVGLVSLVLMALTLVAYRRTNLKRLIPVSAAFGLFALKTFVRHVGLFVLNWGFETADLVLTILDFMILVMFFLSVAIRG